MRSFPGRTLSLPILSSGSPLCCAWGFIIPFLNCKHSFGHDCAAGDGGSWDAAPAVGRAALGVLLGGGGEGVREGGGSVELVRVWGGSVESGEGIGRFCGVGEGVGRFCGEW